MATTTYTGFNDDTFVIVKTMEQTNKALLTYHCFLMEKTTFKPKPTPKNISPKHNSSLKNEMGAVLTHSGRKTTMFQ